jgi:hypothetical protein
MGNWGKWRNIEGVYYDTEMLNKQGLYQIRMVDTYNNPIPISRLAETDESGIIYIGQSTKLRPRIENFYCGRHSGGGMYGLVRLRLKRNKRYKGYSLQYRYMNIYDSDMMKKVETNLLRSYFRKYCELPPFNSTVPGGK